MFRFMREIVEVWFVEMGVGIATGFVAIEVFLSGLGARSFSRP